MFVQVHWCWRPEIPSQNFITCLSADNEVFPFQRTENNFRQCRHRKVATTHTLPRIQTSLSLKKLSMVRKNRKYKQFPLLLLLSEQAVSYFSFSAAGLSVLDCKLLTFGKTLGLRSKIYRCPAASKAPKRLTTFNLQTDSEVWRLCRRATCLLGQQSTLATGFLPCPSRPPPSLHNHPGPKRRGHAVCEMRIWQVVLVFRVSLLYADSGACCLCCCCCWYVSETPAVSFNSFTQHFT